MKSIQISCEDFRKTAQKSFKELKEVTGSLKTNSAKKTKYLQFTRAAARFYNELLFNNKIKLNKIEFEISFKMLKTFGLYIKGRRRILRLSSLNFEDFNLFENTLVHELLHAYQDFTKNPLDHGDFFISQAKRIYKTSKIKIKQYLGDKEVNKVKNFMEKKLNKKLLKRHQYLFIEKEPIYGEVSRAFFYLGNLTNEKINQISQKYIIIENKSQKYWDVSCITDRSLEKLLNSPKNLYHKVWEKRAAINTVGLTPYKLRAWQVLPNS